MWDGWDPTAKFHLLQKYVFEGVAVITLPISQAPQFPGMANAKIIMTVSLVCSLVKLSQTETTSRERKKKKEMLVDA